MREVKGSIGSELFQGAVYGLGMSLFIWIPLTAGHLADPLVALLCLAGGLAGISRRWSGWPAPAALPWIAVLWLLEGPVAAMPAAVLAVLGSHLVHRRPGAGARAAFDSGSTVLAVVAADAIARGFAGIVAPVAWFAAVFVLTQLGLHVARRRIAKIAFRRGWLDTAGSIAIAIVAVPLTWALATLWMHPGGRAWIAVAVALRLGMLAGTRSATRRATRKRRRRSPAPDRVRDRTASALATSLREGKPGGHLWRTEALCLELADRLGSDPHETRSLSQAALLHHAGQLAYDDRSIDVHPRVLDQTVQQLGFSDDVRTILRDTREWWDGSGPRHLRGERISRGGRILAVADRYDQLAHGSYGPGSHTTAMVLLRNEAHGRFDPLMFDILDELGDRLTAGGADLTESLDAPLAPPETALVRGEHDLQTMYSIERATTLPIGLHERLTLIAGLLRTIVPFAELSIDLPDDEAFRYGDRVAEANEQTLELDESGATMRLTGGDLGDLQTARLVRAAQMISTMIADDERTRVARSLTDPQTGLPNARHLRNTLDLRIPGPGHAGPGFGLIALHLRGLGRLEGEHGRERADRYLVSVAKRLAAACDERETLVRLGPEQFIVITAESRSGELVRRWHELVDDATCVPLAIDGQPEEIRFDAAHAAHPLDGDCTDTLLATLESRLTGRSGAVVPFRATSTG